MGEPPKDFLALTHGEEWVNFYESFDKLVQDNLSRSSDLLKRAMTLPEVADREVARVKDEHQAKLVLEHNRQRAVLTDLRDEVANSQRQISTLTRSMGGLLADLERLSGRITSALGAVGVDSEPITGAVPVTPRAAPEIAVAKPQTAPLVNAARPQTGPLAATAEEAAQAAVDAQASIDLNALAEAETEKPAEPDLVASSNGNAERQRPHWLSVTRPNSTN